MAQWGVGLIAVVVMLSVPIGFFAAPHGESFNWEVCAIVATALGTTLLAAFTGTLAFATSGDLRATWELADAAKKDREERSRPIVVLHPPRFEGAWGNGRLFVLIANAGLGPAIGIRLFVTLEEEQVARGQLAFLATQAEANVSIQIAVPPKLDRGPPDSLMFSVSGNYYDRTGQNFYATVDPSEFDRETRYAAMDEPLPYRVARDHD